MVRRSGRDIIPSQESSSQSRGSKYLPPFLPNLLSVDERTCIRIVASQ